MPMILTDEQTMLRDSAREFCQAHAPVAQLRALRDSGAPDGFDRPTWAAMVDLGWAAIPFPEAHGGLDFGYKGLGLVTLEAGRTLAASPLLATVWLAGTLVAQAGTASQCQAVLPGIASGERLLAVALEEGAHHAPEAIACTAVAVADGWRLDGHKTLVLDGHVADTVVVVARTDEADGPIGLFLVPAGAPGLAVTRTHLADNRNSADLLLDGVVVSADGRLGTAATAAAALAATLDIARIGLAAEMFGGLQETFDRTIAYLKERQQFGQPIGSFQALKHRAADMFCELELARSTVLQALSALDEGAPPEQLALLASLAKAKVGEAFRLVSREAVQMHGGNGMTDEYDIGLFLKRAAVAEQTLGSAAFHQDRWAVLQGY